MYICLFVVFERKWFFFCSSIKNNNKNTKFCPNVSFSEQGVFNDQEVLLATKTVIVRVIAFIRNCTMWGICICVDPCSFSTRSCIYSTLSQIDRFFEALWAFRWCRHKQLQTVSLRALLLPVPPGACGKQAN